MSHQTIVLRDWVLGAGIAVAISIGASAGTKPVAAASQHSGVFSAAVLSKEVGLLRLGLGQVLDIAGEVAALAKQI